MAFAHSDHDDWRLAETYYQWAVSLSDREWAWEFLRRNPQYRVAAQSTISSTIPSSDSFVVREQDHAAAAIPWGLLCFRRSEA